MFQSGVICMFYLTINYHFSMKKFHRFVLSLRESETLMLEFVEERLILDFVRTGFVFYQFSFPKVHSDKWEIDRYFTKPRLKSETGMLFMVTSEGRCHVS